MKNKLVLLYFNFLIINYNQKINQNNTIIQNNHHKKFTIIFIHGSYGLNFNTLLKIVFFNLFNIKKLKKLFEEITILRFNKNLSEHKSICGNKKGLEAILEIENKASHYTYEYVFKFLNKQFEITLNTKDINYYSFNWNGCLDNALRYNEAYLLYNQLEALKKNDPTRKIIIIGYSHGGNIALSLQQINEKKIHQPFVIDLLILLATPIGKISQKNAEGNLFSQIINFYSSKDLYQISDFFFNFPKTKRFFKNNKKIINIDFKYLQKTKNPIKKNTVKIINPEHRHFGLINLDDGLPIFLTLLPKLLYSIKKNMKINIESNNYNMVINLDNIEKIKILKKKS